MNATGTPIFDNEEEEQIMLSVFFSVAEKNGRIRKTKQSETHRLQTLLNACARFALS